MTPRDTSNTDPDTILAPIYNLNFCEKCGAMYGNCEHHPIKSRRQIITKAELKKLYGNNTKDYRNISEIQK